MATKNTFAATVHTFEGKSLKWLERTRRGVVLKLFGSVVMDTPVDTGRLRGNWRTSVHRPALEEIERLDKSGSVTINEVQANMGDGTTKDISVFFTNNLPYAEVAEYGGWNGPTELVTEEGYSRKSPAGMVRKNVVRVNAILAKAAREGTA